ncbi:hypothetical protein B0H66DRAFT_604973 [Apodospora peruviana]|uniref:Plus3 domain-containing protein n=1 Tax=Apodospora peruviana TaxID=516989 RepID=A0AAE0M2T6_9PEZI|nr:hypothetical protein B0H66DRAFT_604973 [Apodospora peruviana]
MSDIEDELLALAGGDVSSDNEEEAMDMSRDESRSPSPAPAPAQNETPVRGVATKKTPAKKAKQRARSDDESEDEGEAPSPGCGSDLPYSGLSVAVQPGRFSHQQNVLTNTKFSPLRSSVPPSPSSQQSAPMDESDSDSDSPHAKGRGGDDDLNQYPVDGLFRDYDEKEQIMGMREIEREQILAERREENERIRQNRMLRQLKVNQDKDNKKRKASAADLEDAQRKTSRIRTKAGETSKKMDTLRRAREELSSRKEQRERENDRRKQRSPSYRHSEDRDDGDSDVEWAGPSKSKQQKSKSPEIRESPPADLRDIERIRVGRSRFAEVCFYPGFEEAITGCYVRISIGPDPTTRQDVYRMAVIKGFSQGRPYAMPDSSGQQMVVDMYVKAAHGKAQREWPFIMCSDRDFTEAEWNRYKTVCAAEGVTIPNKAAMVNKIADINKLVRRHWTEKELSEKLERQNSLRIKFSGNERETLVRKLEQARAHGDEEAVAKLQAKLETLEVPRLAFKTSLTPQKKQSEDKGPSEQERLAQRNIEARRKNAESVRKAQLAERAKGRKIDRGEVISTDSSRRVRTTVKFLHDEKEYDDVRGKIKEVEARKEERERAERDGRLVLAAKGGDNTPATGSGASTPANGVGTPKLGAQKSLLPHIAKLREQQHRETKNGIPVIHKPLMDDDIIGALDLDIDIDI